MPTIYTNRHGLSATTAQMKARRDEMAWGEAPYGYVRVRVTPDDDLPPCASVIPTPVTLAMEAQ